MDIITVKDLKNILKEELEPIKKTLDEHTEKLDSLTLDMADVQKKTDAIPDIRSLLEGTKTQIDDHEERITTLEAA